MRHVPNVLFNNHDTNYFTLSVSFPEVIGIDGAFNGLENLRYVNLPKLSSIGSVSSFNINTYGCEIHLESLTWD